MHKNWKRITKTVFLLKSQFCTLKDWNVQKLVSDFSKVAEYEINIQKLIFVFLYIRSEQLENENVNDIYNIIK